MFSERIRSVLKKLTNSVKKLLSITFIRYGLSSLAAFAVNYIILLLLEHLLEDLPANLEIAATAGWIVSSNMNFFVNRRFVFNDNGKIGPEYAKYYTVAIPVFLIKNLGLLEILVRLVHIPTEIASPLAETIMFILTYFFQKALVFGKKKQKEADTDSDTDI